MDTADNGNWTKNEIYTEKEIKESETITTVRCVEQNFTHLTKWTQ